MMCPADGFTGSASSKFKSVHVRVSVFIWTFKSSRVYDFKKP